MIDVILWWFLRVVPLALVMFIATISLTMAVIVIAVVLMALLHNHTANRVQHQKASRPRNRQAT